MADILENLTQRLRFLEEEFDVVVPTHAKGQYWTLDENTGKRQRFKVTEKGDQTFETTVLPDPVRPDSARAKLNITNKAQKDKENVTPQRVTRPYSGRTTTKEKEITPANLRKSDLRPSSSTKPKRDPVIMRQTPYTPSMTPRR